MIALQELINFMPRNYYFNVIEVSDSVVAIDAATHILGVNVNSVIDGALAFPLPSLAAGYPNPVIGPASGCREIRFRNNTGNPVLLSFTTEDETTVPPAFTLPADCTAVYTAMPEQPVFAETRWFLSGGWEN